MLAAAAASAPLQAKPVPRAAAAVQTNPAARQQTAASMPEARRHRAEQFFASPAGQRLIAIGPRKSALDQKWFNYSPPGMEERVAAATAGAMVDHIGKTDPALAAKLRDLMVEKGILPKS